MHDVQADLCARFGISWDYFGRTSAAPTHQTTQHLYKALDDHGLIEERTTRQIYSVDDARFLPDRYVEGTCPHCDYERARGDQCENCTRVLDPTDLINPRSAISGSTNIEVRESRHLFLRQSQMVDHLRKWIASKADWPHLVTSIANKWLDEGLHDRGITRDLSWGIPVAYEGVARPGFENKVFYVWFDAPIGYIGATIEWAEATGGDWERWWRTDKGADDVRYVQIMGKDNVPFHTVGFPVTLFGSGEPWKVVDYLKGFNWMNYYGGKFSTSSQRGVFMDQALEILPADTWRWFLIANAPESSDSDFTWETFQVAVNKDLADVLGNFINRISRFCKARFGEVVPEGGTPGPAEEELAKALQTRIDALTGHMDRIDLRKSASELRAIWALGNEYLQEAAPWTAIKDNPEQAAMVVRTGLNLVALFATLSAPFIPDTATKIRTAFKLEDTPNTPWPEDAKAALTALAPGHEFTAPDVLFAKLEDEQIAEWKTRFGGES